MTFNQSSLKTQLLISLLIPQKYYQLAECLIAQEVQLEELLTRCGVKL